MSSESDGCNLVNEISWEIVRRKSRDISVDGEHFQAQIFAGHSNKRVSFVRSSGLCGEDYHFHVNLVAIVGFLQLDPTVLKSQTSLVAGAFGTDNLTGKNILFGGILAGFVKRWN